MKLLYVAAVVGAGANVLGTATNRRCAILRAASQKPGSRLTGNTSHGRQGVSGDSQQLLA